MNRRQLLAEDLRVAPLRLGPWLRSLSATGAYELLSEAELRATRRSETVFIFGSGSSLNDVSPQGWQAIGRHDTLGFNWFVHETFVRCDYHLIRGIPDDDLDEAVWRPQLEEYFAALRANPRFADTIFLVHGGFRAINGNRAIGLRYLPGGSRIFRWRSNKLVATPTMSFAEGLAHGESTLMECVNFASLLGWRRIVLAGVDLYDRRYFWLAGEETRSIDTGRGATAADRHARAESGMIDTLRAWRSWLGDRDVELFVYDRRSLLAGPLPVYEPSAPAA